MLLRIGTLAFMHYWITLFKKDWHACHYMLFNTVTEEDWARLPYSRHWMCCSVGLACLLLAMCHSRGIHVVQ